MQGRACFGLSGVANTVERIGPKASMAGAMGLASDQPKRAWLVDFDTGRDGSKPKEQGKGGLVFKKKGF